MFGYRFNNGEWSKIRTEFNSIKDFYDYVEEKHIERALCTTSEIDKLGRAYVDTNKKRGITL